MGWQIGWQGLVLALLVFMGGLFLGTRLHTDEPVRGSAAERLQPATAAHADLEHGSTVYVPIYSSVYSGLTRRPSMVELAATLSVRNVSSGHSILLEWVRYYDSKGQLLRDHIDAPSVLPPLSSVEFVIPRADTTGGPGASFLVHWKGPPGVDEPVIEAVMLGQDGNGAISFTSQGRTLQSDNGAR